MDESNPELESFRQQWRAEVSARKDDKRSVTSESSKASKAPRRKPGPSQHAPSLDEDHESEREDHPGPATQPHQDIEVQHEEQETINPSDGLRRKGANRVPRSALEHYEKAVEREAQGSLGDSLDLYRKAFRMDDRVDQHYKNKHFPPSYFAEFAAKKAAAAAAAASSASTSAASKGVLATQPQNGPQDITQLIAGFSAMAIEPCIPEIEGTDPLPCPIAALPDEIIIQILFQTAILDVASFARLSQVCKRLAYLVATEEQVWKRVCLGSEFGFEAMHYKWQKEISGDVLEEEEIEGPLSDTSCTQELTKSQISEALLKAAYTSSWRRMFRTRPRVRFNGCYISTVNYIRPGQASPNQVTWSSPVHIVTYYRYLRFFRDGTVISLLSVVEPSEVVHFITKELLESHKGGRDAHLPSAFMKYALKGRWRLSSASDNPEGDLKDAEGDVFIETDGVDPKYIYRMELSLKSAGKGVKNNKLVWKGFWSYNKLTDDWGEFGLRNDKAFFWSRVKSYGMGK